MSPASVSRSRLTASRRNATPAAPWIASQLHAAEAPRCPALRRLRTPRAHHTSCTSVRLSSVRKSWRCSTMARKRQRTAQSRRARRAPSARSLEEIRAAALAKAAEHQEVGPRCPRCSELLPLNSSGRGRPRVWCSQVCRRAAYEERRAAAAGAIAKEVVVKRVEPSWEETIERVLESPKACKQVLRALRKRLVADELANSPWNEIQAELWTLSDAWSERARRYAAQERGSAAGPRSSLGSR